jgi:hypothetical protein
MAKIERLTPEEEALIPIVRDEWIKIGLATGLANREAAQAAISDAYRMAGLEPPRQWIWFGSPLAGCIGAWMLITKLVVGKNQVRDQIENEIWDQVRDHVEGLVYAQVGNQLEAQGRNPVRDEVLTQVQYEVWERVEEQVWDQVEEQVEEQIWGQIEKQVWDQVGEQVEEQVRDQVEDEVWNQVWHQIREEIWDQIDNARYGGHNTNWLAFLDLFRRMKRVQGPERLEPLMRLAANAGWWWPFERACIITERPTRLLRDTVHRLHCAEGPALTYPDGWALYRWHGLLIPAWFIEEKQRITPDAIDAEANAELRRVMLEIFGFDRYIAARGASLIAEDECLGLPRQLFEIDLKGEPVRVLRVVNGTVEADGRQRQFHLGVPLECNTPHEAAAWSYGRPMTEYREALRT